ncbi:MAG: 4-phosphopantetheinyl transferase [Betaproteobacteria bacterium]|nr:4-phosphopantetheinyl transferase [Betaproteobacteria bacterium]
MPADEVHLWLVFDTEVPQSLLPEYRRLLTDAELQREQRFHFPRHRRQFLITRALVRTVLSRYESRGAAEWRFITNDHGRPSIRPDAEREPSRLSFNLSHTDGLVVCAVAQSLALGVDAEKIRRQVSLEIADGFFSKREAADVRSLPQRLQHRQFFQYWTLKESYIKAKGLGLSIPLDAFSFNAAEAGNIAIAFEAKLTDSPAQWRFWSLQPSPAHLVAVCAQRIEDVSQALVLRKTVPLLDEQPYTCEILRRSD